MVTNLVADVNAATLGGDLTLTTKSITGSGTAINGTGAAIDITLGSGDSVVNADDVSDSNKNTIDVYINAIGMESDSVLTLTGDAEYYVWYASGQVKADGTASTTTLTGNIRAHASDDGAIIITGKGDDILFGGLGNDSLVGGYGNDLFYGGLGNNVFRGDNFADVSDSDAGVGTADTAVFLYDYKSAGSRFWVTGGKTYEYLYSIDFGSDTTSLNKDWDDVISVTLRNVSDSNDIHTTLIYDDVESIRFELENDPNLPDYSDNPGSSIDPDLETRNTLFGVVINLDTAKKYGLIQDAINDELTLSQHTLRVLSTYNRRETAYVDKDLLFQIDTSDANADITLVLNRSKKIEIIDVDPSLYASSSDEAALIANGAGIGNAKIFGTGGDDIIILGGLGIYTVDARGGNDVILVDNSANLKAHSLGGGSGNDVILGGYGNNLIDGGSGNDILVSVGGNDRMLGGSGDDTVVFATRNLLPSSDDGAITALLGGGNDQFVVANVFSDGSIDVAANVLDFTRGDDVINLSALLDRQGNLADLTDLRLSSSFGSSSTINLDNYYEDLNNILSSDDSVIEASVTLSGVNLSRLSTRDTLTDAADAGRADEWRELFEQARINGQNAFS